MHTKAKSHTQYFKLCPLCHPSHRKIDVKTCCLWGTFFPSDLKSFDNFMSFLSINFTLHTSDSVSLQSAML